MKQEFGYHTSFEIPIRSKIKAKDHATGEKEMCESTISMLTTSYEVIKQRKVIKAVKKFFGCQVECEMKICCLSKQNDMTKQESLLHACSMMPFMSQVIKQKKKKVHKKNNNLESEKGR